MKKVWFIVIFLLIILLSYTVQFRYFTSEAYKKNINKEYLFTGGILTIRDSKKNTETIYYPIDNKGFKLCINGANILATFFVYDILGYKEYKPSSSSQIINMGNIACLEITPSQKIFSDTEIGIKNILRNTFLDKGGKLVGIAIQLAPLSGENIVIKSFSKYNADRVISELQKQFDSLTDLPIVESVKVYRGDGLICKAMTGYNSSHDYPTLGIKIYTTDECSPSFETEPPFILKNGSILVDPYHPGQYIKVIAKYPSQTIQEIFDRDYKSQFASGCNPLDLKAWWLFSGTNTDNMQEFLVSNSGSCVAGGNGNHQTYMSFLYNKDNPDRYYLFAHQDGCAGGRCNVFNKIELY